MNLHYYDCRNFTYCGEPGTLYVLDAKLSHTQRKELASKVPFIQLLNQVSEYAPEIKNPCVWVPSWALRNTTVFYFLFDDDETWEWDIEGQMTIFDYISEV